MMKTLDQIGTELQGYDPQALSAADVLVFLDQLVTPLSASADMEVLPLFEALGRVLAEDVVSPVNVPPHDNSAMDGYAFDGAALQAGLALRLHCVGTALAGKAWVGHVTAGQCVKIMTGAVMPAGLNTVVPQELVTAAGNDISVPAGALSLGDNRRHCGEDLALGQTALNKGELVTPARLGLAASLGLPTLRCFRLLRVAYFSTGD